MSFLSAITTPHSNEHDNHKNSKSCSHLRSSSRSASEIKIPHLKQRINSASSFSGNESDFSNHADNSFLREVQRNSSLHPSTAGKNEKFLPISKCEEFQENRSQPKSVKSHQNALPVYDDSITRQYTCDLNLHNEPHDDMLNQCSNNKSSVVVGQKLKMHMESRSRLTNGLLQISLNWPFFHAILSEKDSRRIFYFMSLNFSFMLVQAFYGFLTDSLGLISDSIHMFFDCLALGVGLFAAISSKWPPSPRFPFGFGKIESLSGFGNGVFLVLISIEIITEAIERLLEGRETKRLKELLVVSCLGLAVNLVGMACFGHHGHSGHGCGGHTHDHAQIHSHDRIHARCLDHDNNNGHGHDDSHGHGHGHSHGHSYGHSHGHSHDDSHGHSHDHGYLRSYSVISQVDPASHSFSSHECDNSNNNNVSYSNNISLGKIPQTLCTIANVPSFHTHLHTHEDDNLHGIFLHILADTMGSAAVILSTALIYLTGFDGWDPIASCVIAILIFFSAIPLIKSSAKKLLLTLPDDKEYELRDILANISALRGVSSYYAPRFWLVDTNTDCKNQKVYGVIHIIAEQGSDLDDLRKRAQDYLKAHGLDIVIQVENDNDLNCWCGIMSNNRSSIMRC